tara:strand:+ start:1787 stop:2440 length:654 start_codon:yes stop_codon:yes gene_type:complete
MSATARRMEMAASGLGGTVQSFTFVGVSFPISNFDIQVPSGTQAGDIAIAYSSTATGPAPAVYSGFTQIAQLNSVFEEMFQYKLLTSGDLTTTFTRQGDTYDAAIMMTFRPALPVTTVNASSVNNSGQTANTPSTQALSTYTYDAPNILVATYSSYRAEPSIQGTFWDGNYLEAGENQNSFKIYYEIQNEANVNRSVVAGGDYGSYNIMMSCVINAS